MDNQFEMTSFSYYFPLTIYHTDWLSGMPANAVPTVTQKPTVVTTTPTTTTASTTTSTTAATTAKPTGNNQQIQIRILLCLMIHLDNGRLHKSQNMVIKFINLKKDTGKNNLLGGKNPQLNSR